MASIILFAIIGTCIHAGAWYWIMFAVYSVFKVLDIINNLSK